MKRKGLFSLLVSVLLICSFAFSVCALDGNHATLTVTRGGSSAYSTVATKTTADFTSWHVTLSGYAVVGLPSMTWGNNSYQVRMRDAAYNVASSAYTYNASNYTTASRWYTYSDYCGYEDSDYLLASSMNSSSANTGATLGFNWQP